MVEETIQKACIIAKIKKSKIRKLLNYLLENYYVTFASEKRIIFCRGSKFVEYRRDEQTLEFWTNNEDFEKFLSFAKPEIQVIYRITVKGDKIRRLIQDKLFNEIIRLATQIHEISSSSLRAGEYEDIEIDISTKINRLNELMNLLKAIDSLKDRKSIEL